jgi:hypothetical protein
MAAGVHVFLDRQNQRNRLFLLDSAILTVVRSAFAPERLEVRGVEFLKHRLFRIALTLATLGALVMIVAADSKWV